MSNNSLRNYEIHQKLGSGSYGVIYKAVSKKDRSTCVLKQINLGRLNEKAKKNAINEATIMGKLKHPFIVCYYESFIEQRNLNILMEYCDGGDLCYFLKQQNKKYLKQQKIWKFFIQICMGLQHIHKNKILHRDIKTLNIFLNKNEMVKIGDLGVAKMLAHNDFAQTMVGTPYYLSPELCEQKPYNQKSDIWALGCLLYELCTFRHPFEAANQASLILKIIRGKFTPIPEFYSKDLRDMIDWCLDRDYKRRPNANMILSKQIVKKYIEQFKFEKIVDEFTAKYTQPPPKLQQKKSTKSIEKKAQRSQQKRPSVPQNIQQLPKPIKKVMDEPPPIVPKPPVQKRQLKPVIEQNIPINLLPKKSKPVQQRVVNQYQPSNAQPIQKRRSEKRIRDAVRQDEKKILFGNGMPENKNQFMSNLQAKIISSQNRNGTQKVQKVKKDPVYFDIPWKDAKPVSDKQRQKKSSPVNQNVAKPSNSNPNSQIKQKINIESQRQEKRQDKVIVHNKKILLQQNPVQENKVQVQKIKMQKKVQPKVYDAQKNYIQKPKGIIKSGGFDSNRDESNKGPEKKIQGITQRKKSQSRQQNKSNQKNKYSKPEPPKQISNSVRNVRKQAQQRHNYLFQKRQSNGAIVPHYPPRVKKPPVSNIQSNKRIKPQPQLSHHHVPSQSQQRGKTSSFSRYGQVSKQQQQLVANLPDTLNKDDSSDQQIPFNIPIIKSSPKKPTFKLNQINNDMIMQKYEQIISSETTQAQQNNNEQQLEQQLQQNMQGQNYYQEEQIQQNYQLQKPQLIQDQIQNDYEEEEQRNGEQYNQQQQQENYENYDSQLYQLNRFNMQEQRNNKNQVQTYYDMDSQRQKMQESQWPFDDQPELPMMQETETPYFQQNNVYLQENQNTEKTEQQALQSKRQHLQIKLKQNMKREDQINRLMQMKIQECKAVVPRGFQEILEFFRSKINMDKDYTDDDERQVQVFLSKRNLTDQRKFQNIYKIMHFEMELENTRKIIQTICKKLNELQNVSA